MYFSYKAYNNERSSRHSYYVLPLTLLRQCLSMERAASDPTSSSIRYDISGTRAQGRPKSRWEDDVVEDLKVMRISNWNKKTSDRIEWRRIVAQAKTFSK